MLISNKFPSLLSRTFYVAFRVGLRLKQLLLVYFVGYSLAFESKQLNYPVSYIIVTRLAM
jgi:hypothetical protein